MGGGVEEAVTVGGCAKQATLPQGKGGRKESESASTERDSRGIEQKLDWLVSKSNVTGWCSRAWKRI